MVRLIKTCLKWFGYNFGGHSRLGCLFCFLLIIDSLTPRRLGEILTDLIDNSPEKEFYQYLEP